MVAGNGDIFFQAFSVEEERTRRRGEAGKETGESDSVEHRQSKGKGIGRIIYRYPSYSYQLTPSISDSKLTYRKEVPESEIRTIRDESSTLSINTR